MNFHNYCSGPSNSREKSGTTDSENKLHAPDFGRCTLNGWIPAAYEHCTRRFPTLLLRKNSRTYQDTQNVSSRTLYTARALLNLLYLASSTANTIDQVHCTQRWNIHPHYTWNTKYFETHCHFVSVSKSPNLALCTLANPNHN